MYNLSITEIRAKSNLGVSCSKRRKKDDELCQGWEPGCLRWGPERELYGNKGEVRLGGSKAMAWTWQASREVGDPCWVRLGKSGPALPPTAPLHCTLSSISGALATRLATIFWGRSHCRVCLPIMEPGLCPGECIWKQGEVKSILLGLQWFSCFSGAGSQWSAHRPRQSPPLRAPWRVRSAREEALREAGLGVTWKIMTYAQEYIRRECVCVCQIHTYMPPWRGAGREEGGERQRNNTTPLCHVA